MNANKPKEETRCECRDGQCPCEDDSGLYHDEKAGREQCPNPAVRFVTVRIVNKPGVGSPGEQETFDTPMCAACADWAEKGAK